MWMSRRRSEWAGLVCLALLWLICTAAWGANRPTLAGTWTASAMTERWSVGEWGDACGPRPSGRGSPGGTATIREEGAELAISGGGAYRTTDCWEKMPGVSRQSHTVSDYAWRTKCASAPNDPRKTTIVTTISGTATTLSFDETGEYAFGIQGQNCTASVRRSRSYALVQREGEQAPAAAPTPEPTPAPTATPPTPPAAVAPMPPAAPVAPRTPPADCSSPGDPARVEVKPARKLLKPGERFAFRSAVVDAAGCVLDVRPTWSAVSATPGIGLTPSGAVTIAEDAPDGKAEFIASVGGRGAHVFVEIASAARYDTLLMDGADAAGADEVAVGVVATTALGGRTAVAKDTARARKLVFVLVVAALALGLAVFGFVLLRRRVPHPAPAGAEDDEPSAPREAPAMVLCPSCRAEFPAGSGFCPNDGNRLVPKPGGAVGSGPTGGICPTCGRGYDPGVRTCPVHGDDLVPAAAYRPPAGKSPNAGKRGKICPSCGGRYGGDATFCGKDGTALVLVN
jgi:hypothetical protein